MQAPGARAKVDGHMVGFIYPAPFAPVLGVWDGGLEDQLRRACDVLVGRAGRRQSEFIVRWRGLCHGGDADEGGSERGIFMCVD